MKTRNHPVLENDMIRRDTETFYDVLLAYQAPCVLSSLLELPVAENIRTPGGRDLLLARAIAVVAKKGKDTQILVSSGVVSQQLRVRMKYLLRKDLGIPKILEHGLCYNVEGIQVTVGVVPVDKNKPVEQPRNLVLYDTGNFIMSHKRIDIIHQEVQQGGKYPTFFWKDMKDEDFCNQLYLFLTL